MNKKLAVYLEFFSFLLFYGMFIILALVFYSAYFSPGQYTTIFVNRFNEAEIEAWVAVPGVLLIGSITLFYKLSYLFRTLFT